VICAGGILVDPGGVLVDISLDRDWLHDRHVLRHVPFLPCKAEFCGPMPADEASDLRREIRELKEELARLKK